MEGNKRAIKVHLEFRKTTLKPRKVHKTPKYQPYIFLEIDLICLDKKSMNFSVYYINIFTKSDFNLTPNTTRIRFFYEK